MRRFFAIVLLAFLPLQFSWAAVAAYCGHEAQVGTEHLGHHDHLHHAVLSTDVLSLDVAGGDAPEGKAPGAVDLDCGHCHGSCSVMPSLPSVPTVALSAVPPRASLDEAGGGHTPTRPERPQWLPLA